ncbi:hypothetical protein B0H12DRAFT_380556 [Mycena haematopus]|nr:hypothetical protein B0H12DRAFT_380556 [Mycena haematopus]
MIFRPLSVESSSPSTYRNILSDPEPNTSTASGSASSRVPRTFFRFSPPPATRAHPLPATLADSPRAAPTTNLGTFVFLYSIYPDRRPDLTVNGFLYRIPHCAQSHPPHASPGTRAGCAPHLCTLKPISCVLRSFLPPTTPSSVILAVLQRQHKLPKRAPTCAPLMHALSTREVHAHLDLDLHAFHVHVLARCGRRGSRPSFFLTSSYMRSPALPSLDLPATHIRDRLPVSVSIFPKRRPHPRPYTYMRLHLSRAPHLSRGVAVRRVHLDLDVHIVVLFRVHVFAGYGLRGSSSGALAPHARTDERLNDGINVGCRLRLQKPKRSTRPPRRRSTRVGKRRKARPRWRARTIRLGRTAKTRACRWRQERRETARRARLMHVARTLIVCPAFLFHPDAD